MWQLESNRGRLAVLHTANHANLGQSTHTAKKENINRDRKLIQRRQCEGIVEKRAWTEARHPLSSPGPAEVGVRRRQKLATLSDFNHQNSAHLIHHSCPNTLYLYISSPSRRFLSSAPPHLLFLLSVDGLLDAVFSVSPSRRRVLPRPRIQIYNTEIPVPLYGTPNKHRWCCLQEPMSIA
jgi:hypothetical protein